MKTNFREVNTPRGPQFFHPFLPCHFRLEAESLTVRKMDEDLSLFDGVVAEFRKRWNPGILKDTIDNKWDHVLIQAFFCNLGKKLGFEVGCEKFRKWDVAWVKGNGYVEVEIELRSQKPIAKAFSKISRTCDALHERFGKPSTPWSFFGILVIDGYLVEIEGFEDYFFDFVLDPKEILMEIFYPKNRVLSLLVIDIEAETYRYAKVGPGRNHQIVYTRNLSAYQHMPR